MVVAHRLVAPLRIPHPQPPARHWHPHLRRVPQSPHAPEHDTPAPTPSRHCGDGLGWHRPCRVLVCLQRGTAPWRGQPQAACRSGLLLWPPRRALTRCTYTISTTAMAAGRGVSMSCSRGMAPRSGMLGAR
ncbi:hypothetical protein PR202_gb25993 [Eleusine coracana subsp. coracana]|uniref:Uncharacterized protein n=1 Tax=Eleusine coracana subsp. coracana TaxID=191504 RepID=A0AAV5FQQ0_ELECO|nr:hypothetical protein PR202_gb25993 [Eleusine coracana subsp. coracana]